MAARGPLSNDDYTIGWVCGRETEMEAAKLLLDEVHEKSHLGLTDFNAYVVGKMGEHNIVITRLTPCQPGRRNSLRLLSKFRSIRVVLMVGIGGGIPKRGAPDIRLGDVVVGKPTRTHGGVVQFDYGRAIFNGAIQKTGELNPPEDFFHSLDILQKNPVMANRKFLRYLNEIENKFYCRPPQDDYLFLANYNHVGSKDCQHCDKTKIVPRTSRGHDKPVVHYGPIASGDVRVRNSQLRDQIGDQLGAYCWDTEAVGQIDDRKFLFIRGISNYADSHQNHEWVGYAVASAAVYAKVILSVTPIINPIININGNSALNPYHMHFPGLGQQNEVPYFGPQYDDLQKGKNTRYGSPMPYDALGTTYRPNELLSSFNDGQSNHSSRSNSRLDIPYEKNLIEHDHAAVNLAGQRRSLSHTPPQQQDSSNVSVKVDRRYKSLLSRVSRHGIDHLSTLRQICESGQQIIDGGASNEAEIMYQQLLTRHEDMRPNKYPWIRELQIVGYSLHEVFNLLLEKSRDAPWVFFEPTTFPRLRLHYEHSSRCCSHQAHVALLGPIFLMHNNMQINMGTNSPSRPIDDEGIVENIAELCGLAGISPKTRDFANWVGSVKFSEQNQVAAASYYFPDFEFSNQDSMHMHLIVEALRDVCNAACLLQKSDLCCASFTFLSFARHDLDSSASAAVQVSSVDFELMNSLSEALETLGEGLQGSVLAMILETSNAILQLIIPELMETLEDLKNLSFSEYSQECLHRCALAIQFLCVGILSYTQAHIGPLQPFFLDTPIRKVILNGIKDEPGSLGLIAEMTPLTCFGNFTRGPVLAFRSLCDFESTNDQTRAGSKFESLILRHDILGRIVDIIDTWGPANFVYERSPTDPICPKVAIKIGDGFIFASGHERTYHWATKLDSTTLQPLDFESTIRIGALAVINTECNRIEADCRATVRSGLEYVGTSRSSWQKSQRQFSLQGGQYLVGQATETWNRQRGISVKEVALASTDDDLLQYMNEYWGLQVSYCTGVARKVPLRILVADLLKHFGDEPLNLDGELRDESFDHNKFRSRLGCLNKNLKRRVYESIRKILTCLLPTGLDPLTGKTFCVAWPYMGDTSRCLKVPLEGQSSWARILADSHDCATFAYITMTCLEMDHVRCKSASKQNLDNTIYLLETSVVNPIQSGPVRRTLENDDICFFSKMDSLIWVKVQREQKSGPASLVELATVTSMARDIRLRLYVREKRKQRDRLKECSTDCDQGEMVSVFSPRRGQ
ncbi:hypothetical protein N7466_003182 [Penicillium verhagenii]|uniref:uncharacterized protein n=1 Tax=Penicillium verhagenii TaxID=1562060 RepID=UPI00254587E2|nr:uncharacterized protein N7466_003182 [Penicillium verhagenii]KAJ5936732.1 hypothetical protein N7466_003182 [Penicillium verhagenii]